MIRFPFLARALLVGPLALSSCTRPDQAVADLELDVAGVGFQTPECALHDPVADQYLISNIAGDPFEKDGDGFISKLGVDGKLITLRWIDGKQEDVELHAPKGMAIAGEDLWVADIDHLRRFDRASGAPKAAVAIPGATFLNDVTVGPDGAIYVSDSGFASGFASSNTDAIWRVEVGEDDTHVATIAQGTELAHPNGICFGAKDLFAVDWDRGEFVLITANGKREAPVKLPSKQLDGLVRLDDGRWLASSWEGRAIYAITRKGEVTALIQELDQPADLGVDRKRARLLIPLFGSDTVLFRKL